MGQQLNTAGKIKSPSESDYRAQLLHFLFGENKMRAIRWVKSALLDPKRRDLAMGRNIGPNRCTLHSALMTCG